MKTMKIWRFAFAMLAAFSLASCGSDNEQEKPYTTDPGRMQGASRATA